MTGRSHFAVGTIGRFMHIFRLTMEPGDATRWEYQIADQLNKQHINEKAHDCDVRKIEKDESDDRRTQTRQCLTTEVKKVSFLLSWCCSKKGIKCSCRLGGIGYQSSIPNFEGSQRRNSGGSIPVTASELDFVPNEPCEAC
jgi:hypothetical protein